MSETTAPADASVLGAPIPDGAVRDPDMAFLRAYEPVVRYTKGELFFPTAVGPYVAQCSLWAACAAATRR